MGQYHAVVNWEKKEYIMPHNIGLGLKQGEQIGNIHASMGDILFLLLAISNGRGGGDVPTDNIEHLLGRWAGDRVFVVGDYTQRGDISIEGLNEEDLWEQLGSKESEWKDISEEINKMILLLWGIKVAGDGWKDREIVSYESYLGPWNKPAMSMGD